MENPPLIEGDSNYSDGIFTGDVKVFGKTMMNNSSVVLPSCYTISPTTLLNGATITAADILNGFVAAVDVSNSTFTMPTAASLLTALNNISYSPQIGDTFDFAVNNSTGGNTIALTGNTGVTMYGNTTQAVSYPYNLRIFVRLTNVTVGSAAYTVYSV
jgi:hypothetical protein